MPVAVILYPGISMRPTKRSEERILQKNDQKRPQEVIWTQWIGVSKVVEVIPEEAKSPGYYRRWDRRGEVRLEVIVSEH